MSRPPRWRQKPDLNQADISAALVKIGCSVYDASRIGGNFPDLVVGYRGLTILLEVKTAKGRVTRGQEQWHKDWKGCSYIVRSPMQAIEAVTDHVKNHQIR